MNIGARIQHLFKVLYILETKSREFCPDLFGAFDGEAELSILRRRQPRWLQNWAAWVLEEAPNRWPLIRRLEREKLIERPDTDFYVLGMIVSCRRESPIERLQSDPELLREIPSFFEVEGGGENSLAAYDKYSSEERGWAHTLRLLAANGGVCRGELLSFSLQALKRDFGQFRAGWYSRFHESLQPTEEEREQRKALYLDLLHSPVQPTLTFALKALLKIAKKSELTQEPLSTGLEQVWLCSKKSTASLGLRLVKNLRSEESRLEHYSQAILHPHVDIASKAMKEIKKHRPIPVEPWLGRWSALTVELPLSLKQDWCDYLGQDLELESEEHSGLGYHNWEPARVDRCEKLEDVCALASSLLESMEPAIDLERFLDGMIRFPNPSSPLLPAVKKRARQRGKSRSSLQVLGAVILTWLGEESVVELNTDMDSIGFLVQRLAETNRALMNGGDPNGLLSLPDFSDGKLSFNTLVERLTQIEVEKRPFDYAQALLRVDPKTVTKEFQPKNEAEKILAWAVGLSKKGPSKLPWPFSRKKSLGVAWKAAELVRYYSGSWSWDFSLRVRRSNYDGKAYVFRFIDLHFDPAEPKFLSWEESYEDDDPSWRAWQELIAPVPRRRWILRGLDSIANNRDWGTADWADIRYLESLEHSTQQWSEAEILLLAFGLGCKESGQFGLSVDITAWALELERFSPEQFGRALSKVASTQMITMNRWAKALKQLKEMGCNAKLGRALEIVLAETAQETNLSKLLQPILEIVLSTNFRFQLPDAKNRLESYCGKSGSGKAAERLLKHFS